MAARAGALFGKAHQLPEEVHQAMVARGYRGDARTLGAPRIRASTSPWTSRAPRAAVASLVIGGDRVLGA